MDADFFVTWSKRTDWCVIDTETTGLSKKDQAIEIAIFDAEGALLVNTLIRPTCKIQPGAIATHGISAAMVRDAPTFAQVAPRLLEAFTGRHVLAYNAPFDKRILVQSWKAAGIGGTIEDDIDQADRWQCVMKAFKKVNGGECVSLEKACQASGLTVDLQHADTHGAWGDAFLTHRLVHKLGQKYGSTS